MRFTDISQFTKMYCHKSIFYHVLPSFNQTDYNKTSCLETIKFITEDLKVKPTNITTIYNDNQNKVYTKVIKMSSLKAWAHRLSGLIKMEGSASTFIESLEDSLLKNGFMRGG
jgi:ribosomal protein S18